MWLLILIALAVVAFVVAKVVLAKSEPRGPDQADQSADLSEPLDSDDHRRIDSPAAGMSDRAGSQTAGGAVAGSATASAQSVTSKERSGASDAGSSSTSGAPVGAPADTSSAGEAAASTGQAGAAASGANKAARHGVDTGDTASDVREMIKILNLRESDAPRLGVEKDEFAMLAGGSGGQLSDDKLRAARDRLVGLLD